MIDWHSLLSQFTVLGPGEIHPATETELVSAEQALQFKLPLAYREYSKTFGAGEFTEPMYYTFAVPGAIEPYYDLKTFHEHISPSLLEFSELINLIEPVRRAVVFGHNLSHSFYYFWDSGQVTNASTCDYRVYAFSRGCEVYPLAESFERFITDICLTGKNHPQYVDDEDLELNFRPAYPKPLKR